MSRIREEVSINAPARAVWKVVHVDLDSSPEWTTYLSSAQQVDGGPPGPGSMIRYELDLPGGFKGSLLMKQVTWDPPRRCAGRFVEGPLKGSWSYSYSEQAGVTRLVYEMDYELGGLLRFAGGLLKSQYEEGIRNSMAGLKRYMEARAQA